MKHLAALLLALAAAAGARAESLALLVGVSGYPTLPEARRLRGPAHDVRQWLELLRQRGFAEARMQVLADGVDGAAAPTRAAILQALDRLADTARAQDTVVVFFAGHGSREPAPGGGLRPILLPLDVGRWDGGSAQRVANAVAGDELRERIDRIAARGAFVWAVFDACHSAALVRGGAGDAGTRLREVEPAELGIDAATLARAEARAPAERTRGAGAPALLGTGDAARGTAYFYAAQSDEVTPELPLPTGVAGAPPRGLFSFVLGRALERGQAMSYRQLAQFVLAEYGRLRVATGTPLFSGSALDAPVLGSAAPPVRQWPLLADAAGLALGAGRLDGLVPGAVFAVLPGPLARDAERLGHLQAGTVEADRSTLVPLARGGLPPADPELLRARSGLVLRLVASPPEFVLRVAAEAVDCAAACPLREALQRLRAEGVPGVELQWVEPGAGPDLRLQREGDRLAYRGPADGAEPPGLALREAGRELAAPALLERLRRDLHAIARARNLLALAARGAAGPSPTALRATLRRGAEAIAPEQVAALRSGDVLALELVNAGTVPLDVTALYADAEHGIGVLFPNRPGDANRLMPGERRVVDDIRIHAPPAGLERLLLISAPAQAQAERSDYSFLAQPSLPRQRGAVAAADDFEAFADAAFADYRQRGAPRPVAPAGRTGLQLFTLRVQAPR